MKATSKFCVLFVLLSWPFLVSCGAGQSERLGTETIATPLKKVVWMDRPSLSPGFALRMKRAGVDEVVVRLGSANFGAGAPVLRLVRIDNFDTTIPRGIALKVDGLGEGLQRSHVQSLWQTLATELSRPSELIIEDDNLSEYTARLINLLKEVCNVPVAAVISIEQSKTEFGLAAARAADVVVVPAFGVEGTGLNGVGEGASATLQDRLAHLVGEASAVRIAISLKPRTEPELDRWGESLDLICDDDVAELARSSQLDRTFDFAKSVNWSGRDWKSGQSVAINWVDAARLNLFMSEIANLLTPDLAGWDFVSIPVPSQELGIGRDAIIEYLGGRGPAPELELDVRRSGQQVEAFLINRSPFTSGVSAFGNWLEISAESGTIVVADRGSFDRVILGTKRNGEWKPLNASSVDAVRFEETYIDSGEKLRAGRIRLSKRRTKVLIEWHAILTTGEEIHGKKTVK